jgi:hypothetical protein
MSELVLDRLQLLFREHREGRAERPRGHPPKILVDPTGKIRIGDPGRGDEAPGLAEVKPAVFA